MYKCKKGEKQYKMCKEANADYCSDCPHGVKENNIEEDIKILEEKMNKELDFLIENANKTEQLTAISIMTMKQPMIVLFLSILSDYKRVLKENEELKQEKINNYRILALAQNEALGYMQGYEEGKKLKRSAVACVVENQQYYIIKKEIEHYKEYIEKLQKENEKYKRLSEINLKNAEEFKNNMCEHRCLLKSENEELQKENEELTISNKEIDKECNRLEEKEVKLINENEHYKDLIDALETYYDITEEDLEECMKNDR